MVLNDVLYYYQMLIIWLVHFVVLLGECLALLSVVACIWIPWRISKITTMRGTRRLVQCVPEYTLHHAYSAYTCLKPMIRFFKQKLLVVMLWYMISYFISFSKVYDPPKPVCWKFTYRKIIMIPFCRLMIDLWLDNYEILLCWTFPVLKFSFRNVEYWCIYCLTVRVPCWGLWCKAKKL